LREIRKGKWNKEEGKQKKEDEKKHDLTLTLSCKERVKDEMRQRKIGYEKETSLSSV
jgi:hypothetical protein